MVDRRTNGAVPLDQSELDTLLEESLRTTWNARVVSYDHARFPFADWVRDEIRTLGYPIADLPTLHEVVPDDEAYVLSKRLCDATNRPQFRKLVNAFVLEEIAPQGKLTGPLAAQRFLNVRIMLPKKPQGIFPFHTGLLYGHGPASRSLWIPLTDVTEEADKTASMQIIELDRSRELTRLAVKERLGIKEMTELFGRESRPVSAGPGQVCLFSQENIHGNFVNETEKTRVSIDFRIAEARFGDRLARKIPGGYFEIVPESGELPERPDHAVGRGDRSNIIYLNNNTPSTAGIPAHLQRYMVYDYCQRRGIKYEFELFELETLSHLPTLFHIVGDLSCNAILYSIYALPEDAAFRSRIFEAALENDVALFFVNEDLAVHDAEGRAHVEQLLAFASYGG